MIFYTQYLIKKEDIHKNIEKNLYEKNLDTFKQTVIREAGQDFSSGRFLIWKKIIEISKENVIKGYGFQADRKLTNDSAHNVYFYSLISGGLISLLLTIFISIRGGWTSFTILINFIFSNKKYYAFDLIPAFLIPLFLIRGIFESSYGIYSIDYLFFILCFFINEINYKKIIY
jgi:O-antigen ligase